MSIIDWISKRSIRRMMRNYFDAKATGADHTQALQIVVHTWYSNSPVKAKTFWERHWRIQAGVPPLALPNMTKDEAELQCLLYCLILDGSGSSEVPGMNLVGQIEDIYNEFKVYKR
jgi:hypothetical protein